MKVYLPTRENLERVSREMALGELVVLPTETAPVRSTPMLKMSGL